MLPTEITRKYEKIKKNEKKLEIWLSTKRIPMTVSTDRQAIGADYLIIASYGMIEQAMIKILSQYVENVESKNIRIRMFVEASLKKQKNMTFEQIKKVLGEFDSDWEDQIKERCNADEKNAITLLCKSRNTIAHGGNSPVLCFDQAKKKLGYAYSALERISEIIST